MVFPMMPMRCVLTSILLLAAPSLAAQAPTHACAGEPDPAARLACYDRAFPPPVEVIEAAKERARADFGLDGERRALRNPGDAGGQADPERIEARLAKVTHIGGGLRSFELDNGQVWTQTDARSGGQVQAGDAVQVRKAILSGYVLVMPNGVTLRVRRSR